MYSEKKKEKKKKNEGDVESRQGSVLSFINCLPACFVARQTFEGISHTRTYDALVSRAVVLREAVSCNMSLPICSAFVSPDTSHRLIGVRCPRGPQMAFCKRGGKATDKHGFAPTESVLSTS